MEREKKKIKDETLQMLDWQKQNIESRQKQDRDLQEMEKTKLREKWSRDLIEEKQKKTKDREEVLSHFKEIEEFNEKELLEKKALVDLEKQRDKDLINRILEKEKGLDEIDKKEKVNFLKKFFE